VNALEISKPSLEKLFASHRNCSTVSRDPAARPGELRAIGGQRDVHGKEEIIRKGRKVLLPDIQAIRAAGLSRALRGAPQAESAPACATSDGASARN
jgi:hypothetical protein